MKQKIVALLGVIGIFALFLLASCTSSSTAPVEYDYGACSWPADSVQFEKGPPPVIIWYEDDDHHVAWQYPIPVHAVHVVVVDFRWHQETCLVKQYELQ